MVVLVILTIIFLVAMPTWSEDVGGVVPFLASVRHRGQHICSGAILDETWILTGAICIPPHDLALTSVVVGISNLNDTGPTYKALRLKPHPKNVLASDYTYDIGLIQIDGEIEFNNKIYPIDLSIKPIKTGENLHVYGWKNYYEDFYLTEEVQELEVITTDIKDCGVDPEQKSLFCLKGVKNLGNYEIFNDEGGPIVGPDGKLDGLLILFADDVNNNFIGLAISVEHFLDFIIDTIFQED